MLVSRQRLGLAAATALAALFGASGAFAQVTPTQVLDRVNAVSPKAILEMAFEDPAQATPFDVPPVITTTKGFSACQLTATKGLLCLDQNNGNPGRWVRKWNPVTASGEQGTATAPYFSCEDPVLGLDTSRGAESCTGITADENGGVVIAGKRKGGYNLIKVVSKADSGISCTSTSEPWRQLTSNTGLCRKVLLPRDRPLLVDVSYTKLSLPGGATCTGVLGLEVRTTLMFFKDPDVAKLPDEGGIDSGSCSLEPLVVADGGSWGLTKSPKELLQGATVVKFPGAAGPSFAVVVSSSGRVLAKRTDLASQVPFELKLLHSSGSTAYTSMPALRGSRSGAADPGLDPLACETVLPQKYGIRTSTKSGSLYITDQNFCEVTALKPASDSTLSPSNTEGLQVAAFTGRDLVLATKLNNQNTTKYPPLEPTLAPGISIDLSKCAGTTGCTLVAAADGGPAATLSNVSLASTAKGLTLFQIKNIPDCRWIPSGQQPAVCSTAVRNPSDPPKDQYLNIAPLLPREVTDQFPAGFFQARPMYLSPNYRAQVSAGRLYFDAFFFVPQDGVVYTDVLALELEIEKLTQVGELGCSAPYSSFTPVSQLLQWDVTTTISEFARVVGGPDPLSYTDMFINTGCGSSKVSFPRSSALPYNLELTPTIYHEPGQNGPPDDYFVHVAVDLFYDLRKARTQTACESGGPLASVRLLDGSLLCSGLAAKWDNAKQKLNTCITDGNYPKKNEAVANCSAFRSQLQGYADLLNAAPVCVVGQPCSDPDNRLGEQKARVLTILHVFDDALLPSLPPDGWRYPRYEGVPLPP